MSAPPEYEPPRIEVLGTIEELTMGSSIPTLPDTGPLTGTIGFSDRRLKRAVEPVDSRALLRQVPAALRYEPPRIEVLGTVEELTMGFAAAGLPDNMSSFGSIRQVSDKRLKHGIATVDMYVVLGQVGIAQHQRK